MDGKIFKYLALLYAFLIFLLSAIPGISPPSLGVQFGDKILHFIEYGIFSLLLFLAFFSSRREFFKRNVFLLSSLVGIAYAFSDEFHQRFVPGRDYDLLDFLADCLGVLLIQVGIWFYLKKKGEWGESSGSRLS